MTWARGSTRLPAALTPGTLVRPVSSAVTQPSQSTSQPRPTRRWLFGTKRGGTNSASRGTTQPSSICRPRRRSSSITSCSMTGGASTDDRYVVLNHAHKAEAAGVARQRTLLFLGNGSGMSLVEDTSAAIAAALDHIGPRLKRLRTQRRITL